VKEKMDTEVWFHLNKIWTGFCILIEYADLRDTGNSKIWTGFCILIEYADLRDTGNSIYEKQLALLSMMLRSWDL
jgi:hypothetical protein